MKSNVHHCQRHHDWRRKYDFVHVEDDCVAQSVHQDAAEYLERDSRNGKKVVENAEHQLKAEKGFQAAHESEQNGMNIWDLVQDLFGGMAVRLHSKHGNTQFPVDCAEKISDDHNPEEILIADDRRDDVRERLEQVPKLKVFPFN